MQSIMSNPYDAAASVADRMLMARSASPAEPSLAAVPDPPQFSTELDCALQSVKLAQLSALNATPQNTALPPKQAEKIDKAAEDMEALFVGMMLKAMWKTIPESEFGMKGTAGEIYRDMFIDKVAGIASKGRGIGLKQVIREEMIEKESGLSRLADTIA